MPKDTVSIHSKSMIEFFTQFKNFRNFTFFESFFGDFFKLVAIYNILKYSTVILHVYFLVVVSNKSSFFLNSKSFFSSACIEPINNIPRSHTTQV